MSPEIGAFALILALCVALIQAVFPFIGAGKGRPQLMEIGCAAARIQAALLILAFAALGLKLPAFTAGGVMGGVFLFSHSLLPWIYIGASLIALGGFVLLSERPKRKEEA